MQRLASAWGRAALRSLIAASLFGGTASHAQGLVHFDLPSQPLAQALRQIGTLTNTDILVAAPQVAGRNAPALQADLTTEEALARVLAGSGLKARHVDDHTIVVASVVSAARDGKARPAAQDDPAELVRVTDPPATPEAEAPREESPGEQKKPPTKPIEEVVVTGTHIRGESPSSPVLTFDQTDIQQSGLQTVGDFLRSIPQNYGGGASPLLSTAAAPGNNPISYGSAPNLRGLGPGSTLTLLNGRRLAEDYQGAVDISPIPLGAIERIEIVPDGASAAYGSDAVAGVVNIILRDRFDGAQTTGSIGTTSEGGGTDIRASQLVGGSWSRGSGLLDYEYEHQGTIYSYQRSFTETADRPYTLIPSLVRNSVFATLHEELGDSLSAFTEGYYSTASKNVIQTIAPLVGVFPVDVHDYDATLGLDAHLIGEWRASAFASQASDHTVSNLEVFFSGLKSTPDLVAPSTTQGRTTTVEAHADGPLPLPAPSPIRLAVGGGERWESFTFNESLGEVGANGRRRVDYVFAEAAVPLVAPSSRSGFNRLELDVSGRYEHYSDVGDTAVPRLGLAYVPDPQLTLRSSWGKSYRAPLLDYTTAPTGPVALFNNIADPLSPTGKSNVLEIEGGNPALVPERATTFSAGLEFRPRWASGLTFTASYFHILYLDRIQQLSAVQVALTTPADASLVVRNPSPAMQQALIAASALGFENFTSSPYDPATIAAIIDGRWLNVASQRIDGGDFGGKYLLNGSLGGLELFLDATLLTIEQRQTPSAPPVILTGQPYEPPHSRGRGGATWTAGPWSATAMVNYLGGGTDPNTSPGRPIASWTTIDARIAWTLARAGARPESQLALAVQNLFDRDPPNIAFTPFIGGLNYDPTNVTPLGRFVSLTAGVRF